MGKAYRDTHPNDPYDLSDPAGIAQELAQEAVSDAKHVASTVSEKVSDTVSDAAAAIKERAEYAYEQCEEAAESGLMNVERFIRTQPIAVFAVTAALSFLLGTLLIRNRDLALQAAHDQELQVCKQPTRRR